jgi:gliding motility-associated-like protein
LPTDKELPFFVVLNLEDKQGCSSTDSIRVQVVKCPAQIFVPNAFMPVTSSLDANSSDSKVADNAVWFFDGYGLTSARCYVYSRWGELVFTKEGWGRKNGWDGFFNNVLCPTGTYKYLIEYTGSSDNQLKRVTGNITLIR